MEQLTYTAKQMASVEDDQGRAFAERFETHLH